MKVLIVGGGIAGLALANFLEDSAFDCHIVEKSKDWTRHGYLITLWNSGRRILSKLGLSEAIDARGTLCERLEFRSDNGDVVKAYDLRETEIELGTAATIVKREDVHELLLGKIPADKVRMNTTISSIEPLRGGKLSVTCTDGSRETYDVVVGADGMNSDIRKRCFSETGEQYENWRVWYSWVPQTFNIPKTVCEYLAPGRAVVMFGNTEKTTAWFMARHPHGDMDAVEGRLDRVRKLFVPEIPFTAQLLADSSSENLTVSDLLIITLKKWVSGGVVLIGDAAHALGPHTGMGVSLALEDAYVLAGEMIKFHRHERPVQDALLSYEKKRQKRVALARRQNALIRLGTLAPNRFVRTVVNIGIFLLPQSAVLNDLEHVLHEEI